MLHFQIYSRDDQGMIRYHGIQQWESLDQCLRDTYDHEFEPETEPVMGWPNEYITWFGNKGVGHARDIAGAVQRGMECSVRHNTPEEAIADYLIARMSDLPVQITMGGNASLRTEYRIMREPHQHRVSPDTREGATPAPVRGY